MATRHGGLLSIWEPKQTITHREIEQSEYVLSRDGPARLSERTSVRANYKLAQ